MPLSKIAIANMALAHNGVGKPIANIETEASAEASAIRLFYDASLDELLGMTPWPFASTIAPLSLVANNPNEEWLYSYRYPQGCVSFTRILSGVRNPAPAEAIPYLMSNDTTGRVIFTDKSAAYGEYTARITDTNLFPPAFAVALSYLLATRTAAVLTAGDPFKLGERNERKYKLSLASAVAGGGNEEQPEQEPDCSFISVRT